jgi:hypothetical protein
MPVASGADVSGEATRSAGAPMGGGGGESAGGGGRGGIGATGIRATVRTVGAVPSRSRGPTHAVDATRAATSKPASHERDVMGRELYAALPRRGKSAPKGVLPLPLW